jgi:hypothetical protein
MSQSGKFPYSASLGSRSVLAVLADSLRQNFLASSHDAFFMGSLGNLEVTWILADDDSVRFLYHFLVQVS